MNSDQIMHRVTGHGYRQTGTGNREQETGNRGGRDAAGQDAVGRDASPRRPSPRPSPRWRIVLLAMLAASSLLVRPAVAQPLAPKDTQPYKNQVYDVTFSFPKSDWVAVPAAGGNIALLMQRKGEASLALDFQVLRVALAPDEIDDTFKEIELEQLTQRAPHARVISSALSELGGSKVVGIHYGASGLTGDLDVTQYSIVSGASLYRLTCASTRATAVKHARACETVISTLVVGKP